MSEPAARQSFEHILESDLQRLAAEVKAQRARPELESAPEKALVKEAIRAFPELKSGGERMPRGNEHAPAASAAPVPPPSDSPLPDYAQSAPAEVKLEIEYLLEVALRQGIGKALDESKKSPYFVQDAFHDALAGKLYPELQRRGVVK